MDLLPEIKQELKPLAPEETDLQHFKSFLETSGYDWKGEGEGALVPSFMNLKMQMELKRRFLLWYDRHPDAWNEDRGRLSHLWFVMTCLGDIIGWTENPWNWIPGQK